MFAFVATALYNYYVNKFIDSGFTLMTQNIRNCVLLKKNHWIEITWPSMYEPIQSIILDNGEELPAPLSGEELKYAKKILSCLKHLNK